MTHEQKERYTWRLNELIQLRQLVKDIATGNGHEDKTRLDAVRLLFEVDDRLVGENIRYYEGNGGYQNGI